jgi:hypothetical protein
MSGLPTRSLRSALGPTFRDPRPIEHPEYELSAAQINLLMQMIVGAQLVMPCATIVAEWNAGTLWSYLHREEIWNTNHAQAHPVLTRTSTGVYTCQFLASYTDLDGQAISFAASSARVTACEAGGHYGEAWVDSSDATLVHIQTFAGVNAADIRFWLEVI